MTATQIAVLILALISLAVSLAVFIYHFRIQMKFRALLKSVSAIVERGQGEAYDSKSPTLHEIVERELGTLPVAVEVVRHTTPPGQPSAKVSTIRRKPKAKG